MLYLFLAEGFEEIEAVTTLDILRRAGLAVRSVGVGGRTVTGAHGVAVIADTADAGLDIADMEMIILPGGMPGTLNLEKSPVVRAALEHAATGGLWIAAICAAPSILGHAGLLEGKRFTCFPGFEEGVERAFYTPGRVVRDGRLITAKGPGAAVPFALEIVSALRDAPRAAAIEQSLQ